MGFDNECILNIQSLPGEYFCPVCRTLIYPNEALQSQCTHLYCKPCLAYIVATTHACPYDGYLVTEADSKPLIESNAVLAETIGKVTVHCLYHRSGCQWQGTLSECITHCTSCTFGNSPVVCNRCGTQIIHRQVQEHTQICPGLQPQAQQVDSAQAQASTVFSQAASQDPVAASSVVPASAGVITATTTANAAIASSVATPTVATTTAISAPASMPALSTTTMPAAASQPVVQASTPQQWYQQQQLQYQQYYQMYPGYDPYQQQYQQYAQYQQQAYTQYAQPQMQTQPAMQGHQQPSSYVQTQPQHQNQPHLQPQSQAQPQAQAQPLPQLQAQSVQMPQQQQPLVQTQPQPLPQPQPQIQPSAQPVQMQAQTTATGQQPFGQPHPQTTQVPQAPIAGQQFAQPLQQFPQVPPQHQLQALPYQQTQQPQQPQSLPQQLQHPHTQTQARPSALQQPPMQPQPQPHPQYPNAHPQSQGQPLVQPQHPAAHAVTGHQSYQPQILQQTQPGAPPQRPMVVHPQQQLVSQHPVQMPNQFIAQQPPRMPPPSGHMPMQVHQQPTQPPPQRPAASHPPQQSHVPAHQHGQQLHQYPGVHAQAPQPGIPQQSHGHLHPGQQFPQGLVPPQQQMHPHGPNIHVATQPPQQNVLPSQGLATHPPQAVAGRPMTGAIPPQPIQQFPGGPGKPIQPSLNQQSPNRLARPGTNLPVMHELQKSHLPQSGSQGLSIPLSGGPHSGAVDKVGLASDLSEVAAKNADGSAHTEIYAMSDIKVRESQSEADHKKAGGDGKDSDIQPEVDSTLLSGRNLDCFADEQNMKTTESKHLVKEELADLPEDGIERSHAKKDGYSGENQNKELKPVEKSGAVAEVQSAGGNLTDPRESLGSREGQNAGEIPGKTQSQQLPVSNSDKSHLIQPTHQPAAASYEGALFQPGYHDRNMSHVAWQGPPQGPSGPLPGKEVCPPQHTPFGHPSNVPPASPRFPAPDRILTPHAPISGGIQDRRPQDGPPYQMQAPGQMRPPLGQSFPDQIPRQGQPSMVQDLPRPPSGQPYGGSYPSDALHGGLPGPGMPSSGRVPGHVGFSLQRFPEHSMAPQGHGQSHLPQPHAGGGIPHGEALPRPPQLVPHSGPFNAPNQMMQRGPPFHPEDRGGPSHLGFSNSLDPEMYDMRRPGFPDARQPDPLGQPNVIKANGIPGNVQGDGMHDSSFAHGAADERFKPLPEERFRRLPEDGISRPYPLDLSRHNVGHRDFEEDLKQFPRPAHLDSEGVRNFDNYNSRPLDRGSQQVGPDGFTRPFDRALPRPEGIPSAFPPNQVGTFSANRPGTEHRMLDVETRRPAGLREEFGRPMDVPPFQSPIRDFGGFPSTRFSSGGKPRLDEMDPRELHGFTERSKAFSLPSDLSAGSFHDSKISLPSMLGSGPLPGRALRGISDGPRSLRMTEQFESGEPINRDRIPTGEPGFGGSYGRDFPKEAGMFNMKRKPGTLGWCRICSVDCETIEGLDLHAQTRDHQKMAMEMVLAIKKECDKKQRISEGIVTHDDSNKSRKNFVKPLK